MQAIQLKVSLITRRHVSASEVIRFLMGLALIDGESESVSIQSSPDEVYQEALVAASVQEDVRNAVSTQAANRLTEINARIGAPMYIAPQLVPGQAGDNVNIGYTVNSSLEPSTAESNLGPRYNQKKIQKSSLSVAMKEELVRTIQRLAQSNHMDLEEFFTRLLLDGEQLVNSAPLGQFEPIDNEMGRTGVSWNVPIKLSTSFIERLNHLHNQYVLYFKKPIHRTTIVRLLIRLALMKYLPTGLPEHGDNQ